MSLQHSVNIQLKLSGDQQLRFLEELVSLLHQDNSNGDNEPEAPHLPDPRPVGSALGYQGQRSDSYPRSDTPPSHALRGRDSIQQRVQIELTSPEVNNEETSLSRVSGPRFPHMPHPPSCPPPQRSAPQLPRTVRPSIHLKRCPSIDIKFDPRLYLNEAELMIVSSNSWKSQHSPRKLSSVFSVGYGSSLCESGNEAGKDVSKSQYWLRENSEYRLQEWLRKKDKECLLKKRKQREIRRREHRKVQAEATRRTEREDRARAAYQEWLQKKRANTSLKIQNQPTATVTTQSNEVCCEEQNGTPTKQPHRPLQRRSSRARSSIRKSSSYLVARQPTGVPRAQAAPSKQVQRMPRKTITALKDGIKSDESLPEDLQQIAKGLRKMRLQQKEYSKRHVYTGLSSKHKTRSRN